MIKMFYVFDYLNDYEQPVSEKRIIRITADLNRADGKNTVKLKNNVFLTTMKDGRFIDEKTQRQYAQVYQYNLDQILFYDGFVEI